MQSAIENFKLELENRKKLTMSGVQSVDGFTSQSLKLIVAGKRVVINGENIKITAFNNNTGILVADGLFEEIKYLGEKTTLVKKLFK